MFPEVWIDDREGSPDFVREIEKAVSRTDFSKEFDPLTQEAFRRLQSGQDFNGFIRAFFSDIAKHRELSFIEKNAVLHINNCYGEALYSKLPMEFRRQFMPMSEFRTVYARQRIIIEIRSLIQVSTKRNGIYSSRLGRTVSINDKPLTVAYTKHLIDRLAQRFCPRYLDSYAALGEIYAWLDESDYFEAVALPKGNLAFSIFEMCGMHGFVQHRYYEKLIPDTDKKIDIRCAIYRAGYCPIEKFGSHAVGTTFLIPGFSKTPEYALLENAPLSAGEKEKMKAIATADPPADGVPTDEYLDVIHYIHRNGIPQAMVIPKPYFNVFRKKEFQIRKLK